MSDPVHPSPPREYPPSAVAIVGMSGRFPGARSLEEFWRNLRDGVESVSFFSAEELAAVGIDPSLRDRPDWVAAGAVVSDIDLFDAAFFGITPREAAALDPQHRLFLECAWEALESAGYDPRAVPGTTGVFGGCSFNSYFANHVSRNPGFMRSLGGSQLNAAMATDFLSLRTAYLFDLRGPTVTLHTACSTALVAVSLAWQSLLNHQCDTALAGGVTVRVPQQSCYRWETEAILAPDGHCRPFDAEAAGTVSGEGAGVVVLRRLEDALRDGDPIRAVLLGAATNNDGRDKVSIYAPSVERQAEVVELALALADVDPATISYVETHGTGTPLGDPIEVAALEQAFGLGAARPRSCVLGAVKSNIGHAEAAAGIAGLLKTVLALEHRQIPPTLHYQRPNPDIRFEEGPFFVDASLREWSEDRAPRRAGVSSFGMGGANAHVVLEESPPAPAPAPGRSHQLLVLSARSPTALDRAAANLGAHLREHPEPSLADVAHTLQVGRSHFRHRRAIVCADVDGAVAALEGRGPARARTGHQEGAARAVFVFPGQGSQHVGMGRGLYESEPVFREELDRCAELLRPHLGLDLRDVLHPAGPSERAEALLAETRITQPALFAIEYALGRLWLSWGVEPAAMIGHSVGEFVAACLAEVLSPEDAAALVAARGALMQDTAPGAMLAVALSDAGVLPLLRGSLGIAAVNAPASCVVSGAEADVAALEERLAAQETPCRRLRTSHAFHSSLMDGIVGPFTERVRAVPRWPAKLRCISTVTGSWVDPDDWTDPEYWARNVREPVRFCDAVCTATASGEHVLLEVGPGRQLTRLAVQAGIASSRALASMRHPEDGTPDVAVLLDALGGLWTRGAPVDWPAFAGPGRRRVVLPTYPFERTRQWVEPDRDAMAPAAPSPRRLAPRDWFWVPGWRQAAALPAAPPRAARWLVFEDEIGLGAGVAERLARAGSRVVRARAGERFRRCEDGGFELRPGSRADHDAMLADLQARGAAPERVVHLWSVVPPSESPGLAAAASARHRGYDSVVALAQAIAQRLPGTVLELTTVSNEMLDVLGGEAIRPERATVLGPIRVLPLEDPQIACRHVDVQVSRPWTLPAADVVDHVLEELGAPPVAPLVARRGRHRWVRHFEPRHLDAPAGGGWSRRGGVCLVTGGLGGIGLALARHLADTAGARLVLTGRSGLPAPGQRARWLEEHGEDDPVSRRIRAVEELEQRGAEVLVLAADVADEAAMRDAVAAAVERFGAVHGVIHAAGLATGGMLALQEPAAAARVLDPKVEGTLVLQSVLAGQHLDFFVLCSSIITEIGGVGAADYCGANAFLDALAESADLGAGTPFACVNWDLWSEVGMGVDIAVPESLRAIREGALTVGIRTEEGRDALARVLAAGPPRRLVVSTTPLPDRLPRAAEAEPEPSPTGGEASEPAETPAPPAAAGARPDLPNAYEPPENDLERSIAELAQELLGIDRIGRTDDMFALGLDSLLSHRMIVRLKRDHHVALPLRVVMEKPTPAELAKYAAAALWAQQSRPEPK